MYMNTPRMSVNLKLAFLISGPVFFKQTNLKVNYFNGSVNLRLRNHNCSLNNRHIHTILQEATRKGFIIASCNEESRNQ